MWRSPDGDRVLSENEWKMFREVIFDLYIQIENDIEYGSNDATGEVPVFDRLTSEQKLKVLSDVTQALREPDVAVLPLTAVNEAVLKVLFNQLEVNLQIELDTGANLTRKSICEVARSYGYLKETFRVGSNRIEEWSLLLEMLEAHLLWDADHEMEDLFLDLPPTIAEDQLKQMNIDPEYYRHVPDDPTGEQLLPVRQKIRQLLLLPVPNDQGNYWALDDLYHGLVVGFCSKENIDQWSNLPWIGEIELGEDEWDCNFSMWEKLFANSVPHRPLDLETLSSNSIELPQKIEVVEWQGNWVVKQGNELWESVLYNAWVEIDHEEIAPLQFQTKQDAIRSYYLANQMYEERANRYEQALLKISEARRKSL